MFVAAAGSWYLEHGNPIPVDYDSWNIPEHDKKLYGGEQFERLLAEFKIVAARLSLPQEPIPGTMTNYAWLVCFVRLKGHDLIELYRPPN
jgi:hypothetical protein